MFRAHILVNELTDAVGAMASLERSARKHSLEESQIATMIAAVGSVLNELQNTRSVMVANGIGLEAKKSVKSNAYDVALEMNTKPESKKKQISGPLSWIRGR